MSSTLWAVTLTLALGQAPCSTCNAGGGYAGGGYAGGGYVGGGFPAGGYGYGYGGGGAPAGGYATMGMGSTGAYGTGSAVNISGGYAPQGFYTNSGGTYDPLYPYDFHETWVHGYWQEMPAYGGYKAFRPYNYKHVLSQSQLAGSWGERANMPYSGEYFRRMQPQASNYDQKYSMHQQQMAMPTAAEIARFRAAQREIPASPASLGRSMTPGEIPQGYAELPSSTPIDPAVYVRKPSGAAASSSHNAGKGRVEELEETVRRQQMQIQAMQGNIPPEYRQAAAAALQKQAAAGNRR